MFVNYLTLLPTLLYSIAVTRVCTLNVTILHTNDIHDRIEPIGPNGGRCSDAMAAIRTCYGGVSRLAAKVKDIRARDDHVILLDAGDWFMGTIWFAAMGGLPTAHFMEAIGYDAMGLGNHEFDRGVEGLLKFRDRVSFPFLSSNIETDLPSFSKAIQRHVVLRVGGEMVGVVGYTTRDTAIISNPGKHLKFVDEISSIRREVRILQSRGINKIIAVGHSGYNIDQRIANEVDGVDVVVGGHSDTFLYTGPPPSTEIPAGPYPTLVTQASGDTVLVVQDYTYGKYLGELQVTWDDDGRVTSWSGNPILLDMNVTQDANVEADVVEWAKNVSAAGKEVVGWTRVALDGEREHCRVEECNMGNMICDAIVHKYLGTPGYTAEKWADIGLVVFNAGGIRSSVKPGPVTLGDIINISPFRNTIVMIELRGKHLLEAFEHSVRGYAPGAQAPGKFLQVSGFRVVYDVSQPDGDRVVSLHVRCTACPIPTYQPIDPERPYKVITNDFLSRGGDGFSVFSDSRISAVYFGHQVSDVIAEYIKRFSPLTSELGGRIVFTDNSTHQSAPCNDDPRPPDTNHGDGIGLLLCLDYNHKVYAQCGNTGWTHAFGQCYRYTKGVSGQDISAAFPACANKMAFPRSPAENAFVVGLIPEGYALVGARYKEQEWLWLDKTPMDWAYKGKNNIVNQQPTYECLGVRKDGWQATSCDSKYFYGKFTIGGYICVKPSDPPPPMFSQYIKIMERNKKLNINVGEFSRTQSVMDCIQQCVEAKTCTSFNVCKTAELKYECDMFTVDATFIGQQTLVVQSGCDLYYIAARHPYVRE